MNFKNADEALHVIEDRNADPNLRDEAYQFLANLDDCEEAKELVESLEDDTVSVRWEAAVILGGMGKIAITAALKALMDPKRVENPRLRQGVIRMIHHLSDPALKLQMEPLAKSLKSSTADVTTMWQAYHLLKLFDHDRCN